MKVVSVSSRVSTSQIYLFIFFPPPDLFSFSCFVVKYLVCCVWRKGKKERKKVHILAIFKYFRTYLPDYIKEVQAAVQQLWMISYSAKLEKKKTKHCILDFKTEGIYEERTFRGTLISYFLCFGCYCYYIVQMWCSSISGKQHFVFPQMRFSFKPSVSSVDLVCPLNIRDVRHSFCLMLLFLLGVFLPDGSLFYSFYAINVE